MIQSTHLRSKRAWLLPCVCLLIGAAAIVVGRSHSERPLPVNTLIYPPADMKYFTLGYRLTTADLLWLRVLQDFDVCDQVAPKSRQEPGQARCNRGWVFSVIDTITELDPKFKVAHVTGADLLSIAVDDREGARLIYEKSISRFPDDFQIPYRASYHYLFEVKQPKRAAELLIEAGRRGAPPWVFSLAARLYSREGQAALAESVLKSTLEEGRAGIFKDYIEKRYRQVHEEIAHGASANFGAPAEEGAKPSGSK